MPCDEQATVARAKAGDEDAFRALVERHGRALYCLACRMTGSHADAEDIVQDTFIRAHRQLSTFEARSGVSTWLYRIGVNCAIDYLRTRPRHRTLPLDAGGSDAPSTSRDPQPDDLVFAREVRHRVGQALDRLSDQERAAFVLRHYHGCSTREICDILGLTTNAAKQAVFRAVHKLRVLLQPIRTERRAEAPAVPRALSRAYGDPVPRPTPPMRT